MSGPDDQEQSEKSATAERETRDNIEGIDAVRHDRIANARNMLLARRLRTATFGHKLAEPAWDMLVVLYVAENRDESVTTSSLVLQTDVPATSAVRWIHVLEADGYVAESSAASRGAGVVRLLPKARELLDSYFAALPVAAEKIRASASSS